MSIPQLFLPVTKMQIQEVRQKIINTTNIFQSLIIQGAAQKIVSNNCNFRNGQCSSNNNTSKWIFIAIHGVCNSNNKYTRYYKHNINRKHLRKIMCKNPIAF